MGGSWHLSVNMILEEIKAERERQEVLKTAGRFQFTCADSGMTNAERYLVLAEEVGEVARAIMESSKLANDVHGVDIRKELIQVAAVALAFVQGLGEK